MTPCRRTVPSVLAVLLLAASAAACGPEGSPGAGRTDDPTPTRPSGTVDAVSFDMGRLEDAGYVINTEQSGATRTQYQDATCVVQTILLPESVASDDASATEAVFTALGDQFTAVTERPDVALPVTGGTLAMRARRMDVNTGTEVVPMQLAARVVNDLGITIAVTHGCYDHTITDAEFDSLISQVGLTGVAPSGL